MTEDTRYTGASVEVWSSNQVHKAVILTRTTDRCVAEELPRSDGKAHGEGVGFHSGSAA
jgi:hypothetical protein